ncbi:MAG: DMT family transporter [Actinomycetota bacterium]|nr:DMT family transporter [Actinomycetota bacterium]
MSAVLALLSSVVWGSSDFLGGLCSKRLPAVAVVGSSQLVGLLAMTLFVLAGHPLQGTRWLAWGAYAVPAGLVGALALSAFYLALASGTMGVVAPIAATGAAVPALVGVALGDQPSAVVWGGMAVAVIGTVLASGPDLRGGVGGVAVRPVALAAFAAVGFGLVLVLIDRGADTSLTSTLWGMRLTSSLVFIGIAVRMRSVGGVGLRDLPWLVPIGLGDLGANALFAVAASWGMVSVVGVLSSLYPVVTILLARVVLHERLMRVQTVGVVVSLLGVVAIAAG